MDTRRPRFTLGQVVGLSALALTALLAALFAVLQAGSRETVVTAAESLMTQASRRVVERVDAHLGDAERIVGAFETQTALGLVDPARPDDLEPRLLSSLAGSPSATEITFTYGRAAGTYAKREGDHDPGELRIAPDGAGQISVARIPNRMRVRRVAFGRSGWTAVERVIPDLPTFGPASPGALDPTLHPTFTVPSRPDNKGRALWSDLSYAESDARLPEQDRHRVVSVQKALWTPDDRFLGVLRVALASDRVDELTKTRVDGGAEHRIFVCDGQGRLISRLSPADHFALLDADGHEDPDGDVRVVAKDPPAEIVAALRSSLMANVDRSGISVGRLVVAGKPYLLSVAALLGARTQGWRVAIVVPEAHYLADLDRSIRRVGMIAALLVLGAALGGALVLRSMRRDIGGLISETTRLSNFEFAPKPLAKGSFRDVAIASESLEQAKTALRALGKYVPLDLVRELYHARVEPMLGGRTTDVTLLFSDIEGFTSLAETMTPNALATALGAYLAAMTAAIHGTSGIIDKYTGDGVMAIWNAPGAVADHPRKACEAALACVEATAALFASEEWSGLPPWRTRFGIHRDEVSVGHFGSPERMSFTAMGDGVNLASRLEGLSKQYGTAILVSAAVERAAREAFWFRGIDRVAVKGRREGVEIFELVGRRTPGSDRPAHCARYEEALAAYFDRSFGHALALLEGVDDGPSRTLAERCRAYAASPPPADWHGIWVATTK